MKKMIVLMLGIFAFCVAQDIQEKEKAIFWYYLQKAEQYSADLALTIKARNEVFENLDEELTEGGSTKIRLYMTRTNYARDAVTRNVTCGTHSVSKLEENVGITLNSSPNSYGMSVATVEYDRALTEKRKGAWAAAIKKTNFDRLIYKLDT